MFCPQCGTEQSEELKFCNKCGANLHAVRQVVATRETDEKFDWNKTWLTEMFLSESERKRRKVDEELRRGITPEVKRFNEIKAGVITSCVGLALMIFLYIFMQGIILSGKTDPATAEILARIWIAGIIPFFVGIGLIINGSFVSKKLVESLQENPQTKINSAQASIEGKNTDKLSLNAADSNEFIPSNISVVDNTTELLKNPVNHKK